MAEFLSKAELCARYNIPPGTLRGIMERRELPYHKIGGTIRFDEQDVLDFLRCTRQASRPALATGGAPVEIPRGRGRPRKSPAESDYYPGKKVV